MSLELTVEHGYIMMIQILLPMMNDNDSDNDNSNNNNNNNNGPDEPVDQLQSIDMSCW